MTVESSFMLLGKPLDFASHNIHLQVKAIDVLEFHSRSFKYRYFQQATHSFQVYQAN